MLIFHLSLVSSVVCCIPSCRKKEKGKGDGELGKSKVGIAKKEEERGEKKKKKTRMG